jgi:hypothetical protein
MPSAHLTILSYPPDLHIPHSPIEPLRQVKEYTPRALPQLKTTISHWNNHARMVVRSKVRASDYLGLAERPLPRAREAEAVRAPRLEYI